MISLKYDLKHRSAIRYNEVVCPLARVGGVSRSLSSLTTNYFHTFLVTKSGLPLVAFLLPFFPSTYHIIVTPLKNVYLYVQWYSGKSTYYPGQLSG